MTQFAVQALVLVGAHGVGKTTVGQLVARALGWPFLPEIGAAMRRSALARDADAHALQPQTDFDEEVIRREFDRDAVIDRPCVVETGHPGNLAYARLRSPAVFARREADVLTQRRIRFVVQPLRMSEWTALSRLSEPGPSPLELVRFFADVGQCAEQLALSWGWTVFPAIQTDALAPEQISNLVVDRLVSVSLDPKCPYHQGGNHG